MVFLDGVIMKWEIIDIGGGKKDIQKMLEENGFKVFNVSIGPISSNWDRAVEVYYQLKGGQVDYGLNHSKKIWP